MRSSHRHLIVWTLALIVSPAWAAVAGGWPQILGPARNGIATEESLVDRWPTAGPPTAWQMPVGNGFAGVSVSDGVAIVFHRQGDHEIIQAVDAATGELHWTAKLPTSYAASIVPDDGPRSVPVIHDGRVYVYGAQGTLACLELASGRLLWKRDTHADYKAQDGYFGAGSSPIIEGDQIIVNVGGDRMNAGIVAFALKDGKTRWTALGDAASYSSPIAATIDGTRHLIFVTRLNAVSLDPSTGKVRFQFPFGKRGPTVNGASPLLVGDRHLFLTASYGIGSVYSEIKGDDVREIWADDVLSSQYTTCIAIDGQLFGVDGRQDGPPANLRCFDAATRKVHWTQPGFGYATLIHADDKLLIMKTNGELVLAKPSTTRYEPLASARILGGTARALPALSNGLLYVRDERTLKCVDLRRR